MLSSSIFSLFLLVMVVSFYALISRIIVHLRNSRVTMHMFCTKNFSYSIFFSRLRGWFYTFFGHDHDAPHIIPLL